MPNATAIRPRTWDEYQGQEEMKSRLQIRLQAAYRDNRPCPHTLLDGPAGIGKTSLAALMAQEVRDPFYSFMMPMGIPQLMNKILSVRQGVFLFDEFHRQSRSAQEDLLAPIADGYFQLRGRKQPMPLITIIVATTEGDKIIEPLRDRLVAGGLVPIFEPYTNEDLTRIVLSMSERLGVEMHPEEAEILGAACLGSPRQAERMVYAARDMGGCDAGEVLDLCGLSPEGLDRNHLLYLDILNQNGGTSGEDLLVSNLGLAKSIVRSMERTLFRLDLIEFTTGGRTLKPGGYQLLRRSVENAHKGTDGVPERSTDPAGGYRSPGPDVART